MAPERKVLVIANPQARHGETAKLVPVISQLLTNLPHDLVVTERPGHAASIAAESAGYDLVVAGGGDGTVHEVLNGLMVRPPEDRGRDKAVPAACVDLGHAPRCFGRNGAHRDVDDSRCSFVEAS